MRILWMVIRQHFKANLQYSKTFWITAIAAPVSMLVFIVLFKSIYAHNQTAFIKGYTLEQMIWYFSAGSFIWSLTWTNSEWRLSRKIISGELAVDLLRPLSVFELELGNAIAHRLLAFLVEFLPCLLVFSLIVFPSFLTAFSLLKQSGFHCKKHTKFRGSSGKMRGRLVMLLIGKAIGAVRISIESEMVKRYMLMRQPVY